MLEFYDNLFRFWAIGLMFFLAAIVVRNYGRTQTGLLGFASALSGAAYLICSSAVDKADIGYLMLVIEPFCYMGPIVVWLFSLSLFQDHFKLNRYHVLVSAGYLLLSRILEYEFRNDVWGVLGPLLVIHGLSRVGLLVHAIYIAWQGWAEDLLENRRKFRSVYIVLVTGVSAVIFFIEVIYRPDVPTAALHLWQSASFAALASTIAWFAVAPRKGLLDAKTVTVSEKKAAEKTANASDKLDLKTINKLVVEEEGYLEAGLTIAKLAQDAKLPEHRLRRLINQHMGYRNFADFLNHYRIDAAKKRLADAEARHTQVLVIAMDLGYGSLGPFNRAFKERTGQTPTEYRKQALAETE